MKIPRFAQLYMISTKMFCKNGSQICVEGWCCKCQKGRKMQITCCTLLFELTGKLYMTVWVGVIDDLLVCEILSFSSEDLRDGNHGFHLLDLFYGS